MSSLLEQYEEFFGEKPVPEPVRAPRTPKPVMPPRVTSHGFRRGMNIIVATAALLAMGVFVAAIAVGMTRSRDRINGDQPNLRTNDVISQARADALKIPRVVPAPVVTAKPKPVPIKSVAVVHESVPKTAPVAAKPKVTPKPKPAAVLPWWRTGCGDNTISVQDGSARGTTRDGSSHRVADSCAFRGGAFYSDMHVAGYYGQMFMAGEAPYPVKTCTHWIRYYEDDQGDHWTMSSTDSQADIDQTLSNDEAAHPEHTNWHNTGMGCESYK